MKKCYHCKIMKDESDFCKDRSRKDGLNSKCKVCAKTLQQTPEHKEYIKQYYQDNKDDYYSRHDKWVNENRELLRERFKTRYRKRQTEYVVNKRQEDDLFRLYCNFSSNMRMSLKSISTTKHISKNGKKWEDIVGYTLSDLSQHLESKFMEGMSWDNYGREWHVDHILPISSFNVNEIGDVQFQKCWSLDNLQPLWAADNIRKSNNIGQEWGNQQS